MIAKFIFDLSKAYTMRLMANRSFTLMHKPIYHRHDIVSKQYWEMNYDFKLSKGDYDPHTTNVYNRRRLSYDRFSLDSDSLRKDGSLVETTLDELTHIDGEGKANMVDVSDKRFTEREAVALAKIVVGERAFALVEAQEIRKGDVLTVSQLAGIMGAKRTSDLIPLCHPLALSSVNVHLKLIPEDFSVEITCTAKCVGQTGVEMEALTGASIAALTVYDMCKAVNKEMVIQHIRLIKKTGGKSDMASHLSQPCPEPLE
eukprot:maker-scaffold61_size441589-snap-gene-3.28 protein:Tk06316 transcript:maker-scaffold61_size441589-snap-gene-3.28-mRNA-1 annotation:"molybdenum cofactor biosynthesis protein"